MEEKRNQGLMKAIKAVHSMVEKDDIGKHRQSQDNIGTLLGSNKEVNYQMAVIRGITCEWVRVNYRHTKRYIILYCHGGGFFTGSMKYARTLTTKLALTTSMDVLCFDYGLAPENPYPKALEDAAAIWDYLMYQGYGSRDIIIAGDSAGANLALSLTLRLKEQGRLLPLALILMSPWTDLTLSGKSHETRADIDPVLNKDYLTFARNAYAPGQDFTNPYISPLFGEFEGFPPVYIQAGDNEVLLNDATRLDRHLRSCGIYSKITIYKGMWHVFQMSPFKTAYAAMDEISEFIFDLIDRF